MRRGSASDNLAYSFTDLMTSLMVIFILLLLVFLNNRASVNTATARSLLEDMKRQLEPAGFRNIQVDPEDPYTIVVPMSGELMTFQPNRHELQPRGESFLRGTMPKLAGILCADKYRKSIDSVIVEGHSDSTPYRGASLVQSQSLNLKLSQDRAMEVVQKTLHYLENAPAERGCFLEKLSATGRGEQDLEATADKSRRVVLKIRVNSMRGPELMRALGARKEQHTPPANLEPNAGALAVLDLLHRLQRVPSEPVNFRLTEKEINDYLAFALSRTPRPGLESLYVKIFPHNYISTFAVIDFEAVKQWLPAGAALLPSDMSGRKPVLVDYRFHIQDGAATFSVEKALYENLSLPPYAVRKAIQALAALQPERIDTEHPIALPFGLRRIETVEGAITGAK